MCLTKLDHANPLTVSKRKKEKFVHFVVIYSAKAYSCTLYVTLP